MEKRWLIYLLAFLVLINIVRAEINLEGPAFDAYNLDDRLELDVSIKYPSSITGFLKTSLSCGDESFDYFLVPIELNAGVVKNMDISGLLIQEGMTGDCNIVVELLDSKQDSLEKIQSSNLLISDQLKMIVKLDRDYIKPGGKLMVRGQVTNQRGNKLEDGIVRLKLTDDFTTEIKQGVFGYEFILKNDYKSGNHALMIRVEDDKGNYINKELIFKVEPVLTKLETMVNKLEFNPGESATIQVLMSDQAGDKINGEVNVRVFNQDNKLVMQKSILSEEEIEYSFPDFAKPGKWNIIVSSGELENEKSLSIGVYEKLDFVMENGKIIVTNVGNVLYSGIIELILNNGIRIEKKTSLKPGETAIIDLSKENIESGSYNIEVVGGETIESFESVNVEHRGVGLGERIGGILPGTGKAVLGSGDDPAINPYLAGLLLLAGILLVILGYKRWNKVKGIQEKKKTMEIKAAKKTADDIMSKRESVVHFNRLSEDEKHKQMIEYRDRLLAEAEKDQKARSYRESKNVVEKMDSDNEGYKILGQQALDRVDIIEDVKPKADYGDDSKEEEEDFKIKKKKDEGEGMFKLFG